MKKTIALALLAFAFAVTCTLEAMPPNLRNSQEYVVSDAGFCAHTSYVITPSHADVNDVVLVENLQYVSTDTTYGSAV